MTVGVLLLAAGRGRRFGADKRRALLPSGQTVFNATLENIRTSGLPLLVCLDAADRRLATELDDMGLASVLCREAGQGMGRTLAEGIAAVPLGWSGVLVALADMPWIEPATYGVVAAALAADGLCRPEYNGQQGHPVGIGRDFFAQLITLQGDKGARDLLVQRTDAVARVSVNDPGILMDIDYPADIRAHPDR